MHVAYVCTDPGIPVFGRKGASVHVQAVLGALLRRGATVELITPRTGGPVPAGLEQVRVHQTERSSVREPAQREVATQRSDAHAGEILDRLHREQPLDLVYERYSLWGAAASVWSARHDVPHLLEVNAPLVAEQAEHRVLVDREHAEHVAATAIGSATVVACVSDRVSDWARRYTAEPKVHTIANGVDTDRIQPAPHRAEPQEFTVGFVGTLKPWHGVHTLVAALQHLIDQDPTYRLLLVGDGPQAEALRDQAAEAGIADHLEMTGSAAPEDIPALLHRMDLATAPYPALEDFYFSPLKVTEYLAAGLPVVASRVGTLPQMLQEGQLGALVPPERPDALAQTIAELRRNPTERQRLADAGRADVVAHHDWNAVVDRALTLVGRS